MSLTTMNWKFVGSSGFATGTVAAALDALNVLGTAVVYQDGTTRTPGSGSAWTWGRYQNLGVTEAMHAAPPSGSQRVVYAGQAMAVNIPTMNAPDVSAAAVVMVGVTKGGGSFTTWDSSTPNGGTFSGYWRAWPGTAGAGNVYLYECQEAILVLFTTTGGAVYGTLAGAFIDPESPDVSVDAESDGRLYGMSVSGSNAAMSQSWWNMANSADFLRYIASNGSCHSGVFAPGTGSFLTFEPTMVPKTSMTSNGLKSRSGRWGRSTLSVRLSSAHPNDQTLGRLREICIFSDAQTPSKFTSSGVVVGHIVSASVAATADAILLLA